MLPELHRLHHNNQIDAIGERHAKAADQVVDALFSAQPVTKEIMEQVGLELERFQFQYSGTTEQTGTDTGTE